MSTPAVSRFPDASQNPSRIEDVSRAISAIQSAVTVTLPEVETLPPIPYPGQLLVHKTGGTLKLKWYDDLTSTWREVGGGVTAASGLNGMYLNGSTITLSQTSSETFGSIAISGGASIGGALTVTGTSAFTGNIAANGTANTLASLTMIQGTPTFTGTLPVNGSINTFNVLHGLIVGAA